ncbi:MAG: hypothetical protein GX061_05370 [Eubacteriaceae bacterium]|nr:hypothetical protein [Eubacteriaceae bacterium]
MTDTHDGSEKGKASLSELMRLPGVKMIRVRLYYLCGLILLRDFAVAVLQLLREKFRDFINPKGIAPLLRPCQKNLER